MNHLITCWQLCYVLWTVVFQLGSDVVGAVHKHLSSYSGLDEIDFTSIARSIDPRNTINIRPDWIFKNLNCKANLTIINQSGQICFVLYDMIV